MNTLFKPIVVISSTSLAVEIRDQATGKWVFSGDYCESHRQADAKVQEYDNCGIDARYCEVEVFNRE
jgi:hypothetical protein